MMARSGEPSDGERGGRRVIENEILGCAGWSGTTYTRGYNRDINDDEFPGSVVTFSAKVPSTVECNEERKKQFGASQCRGISCKEPQ